VNRKVNPRPSRRFNSNRLASRLVPVILVILALLLVATLVIVVLSMAGLTPGY
jgi:hypothetical protein